MKRAFENFGVKKAKHWKKEGEKFKFKKKGRLGGRIESVNAFFYLNDDNDDVSKCGDDS